MRISDWSSDVCSSDLRIGPAAERVAAAVVADLPLDLDLGIGFGGAAFGSFDQHRHQIGMRELQYARDPDIVGFESVLEYLRERDGEHEDAPIAIALAGRAGDRLANLLALARCTGEVAMRNMPGRAR